VTKLKSGQRKFGNAFSSFSYFVYIDEIKLNNEKYLKTHDAQMSPWVSNIKTAMEPAAERKSDPAV
jgi:hypothetical protein